MYYSFYWLKLLRQRRIAVVIHGPCHALLTLWSRDVTWASIPIRSPTTQLFVQMFIQANNNKQSTLCHIDPLCLVESTVNQWLHYKDVIMSAMAFQIISLAIVYSTVCSSADLRKHQGSASLTFVRGIHRWPVNSPHKGPVTRKMIPFDDVIMSSPTNGQ